MHSLTLPIAGSDQTGALRTSGRATADAVDEHRRHLAERRLRRRRIEAIDEFLDVVEERHLIGRTDLPSDLPAMLTGLGVEVGPLPKAVLRCRTSIELHGALLDLQESVLDTLIASRAEFDDSGDSRAA